MALLEFRNDGKNRQVIITQLTHDSIVMTTVVCGQSILIEEKYKDYISKALTFVQKHLTPDEREKLMSNLVERITKVVKDFITNEEQFTLLDVSNAVKLDGEDFVSHSEIRAFAKPIVDTIITLLKNQTDPSCEYYVSSIDVVDCHGNQKTATLYSPDHKDEYEYDNVDKKALSPNDIVKSKTITTSQSQQVTFGAPVAITCPKHGTFTQVSTIPAFCQKAVRYAKVKVRKDGAIELPASLLQGAGVSGFDADITIHPNSISINFDPDSPSTPHDIILNAGTRIRKTTLAQANLTGVSELWVAEYSNKFVIAKH